MRIKTTDTLAGVPMPRIRTVLRNSPALAWALGYIQMSLKISEPEADAVIAALLEAGYIGEVAAADHERRFRTTTKGFALGSATAAAPILRRTADRLLEQFMERVRVVNADDKYLYKVNVVVLFGSYLSDRNDLGDIDIAYLLEQRPVADWETAANESRQRAADSGHRFSTTLDWIFWPEQEVLKFLRSRSRSLRLVELRLHRSLLMTTPHRVLLGTFP